MERLDLLWNLGIHHNSLNNYYKELEKLKKPLSIIDSEDLIVKTEEKLNSFRSRQEEIKRKLTESSRRLKDYSFKIEETEEALYNGSTTNPKQLEYLSQEKDKLKEIISETETEILEFMDEVEIMDKELLIIDTDFQNIKKQNIKLKTQYKISVDELNNKIQIEVEAIKSLEDKIDKTLLKQYTTIRENRGTGIVEVKNLACSGCNIMIPTFMVDKLNKNNEIIYCESCGRILYKQ